MISAYPKIFALGTDYIKDIFNEEVEISEKLDGSQFSMANINGELITRSKGKIIYPKSVDKMFSLAVGYAEKLFNQNKLLEGLIFYFEYLQRPKHNTLKYNRVPKNNLMLFGVRTIHDSFVEDWEKYGELLDVETMPVIYKGKINKADEISDFVNRESILGGCDIEGVVVKNYFRPFLLGGQPIPIMAGKYVSEKFKEVHQKNWKVENTSRGRFEVFKDNYRTESRWEKAVQHLRDNGELEFQPRDIGKLIKEIKDDIAAEDIDVIKSFLWSEFGPEILRYATTGFPEWYKEYLIKRSMEE